VGERHADIPEQSNGAKDIGDNERLEDVQLKVSVTGTDCDGDVVTHHLRGDHRHGLTLRRIHFTYNNIDILQCIEETCNLDCKDATLDGVKPHPALPLRRTGEVPSNVNISNTNFKHRTMFQACI